MRQQSRERRWISPPMEENQGVKQTDAKFWFVDAWHGEVRLTKILLTGATIIKISGTSLGSKKETFSLQGRFMLQFAAAHGNFYCQQG